MSEGNGVAAKVEAMEREIGYLREQARREAEKHDSKVEDIHDRINRESKTNYAALSVVSVVAIAIGTMIGANISEDFALIRNDIRDLELVIGGNSGTLSARSELIGEHNSELANLNGWAREHEEQLRELTISDANLRARVEMLEGE